MKKNIFVLLALVLTLSSCENGTSPTATVEEEVVTPEVKTVTKYVKNSKWETVKTVEVIARSVSGESLEDEVLAYNLATSGDQLTILDEDTPINPDVFPVVGLGA